MPTLLNNRQLRSRANVLLSLLALVFVLLLGRLYYIQVIAHGYYAEKAAANSLRRKQQPALRGVIVSADARILALTRPTSTVCADLRRIKVEDRPKLAAALARLTGADEQRLRYLLGANGSELRKGRKWRKWRKWVELIHHVPPRDAAALRSQRLPGIVLVDANSRFYPYGSLTCHVVGLTTRNHKGLEATELLYEKYLRGGISQHDQIVDGAGRAISISITNPIEGHGSALVPVPRPSPDGGRVVLTINVAIQTFVQEALDSLERMYRPQGIMAVVIEPQTGRILALANRPDFDPNNRRGLKRAQLRNRAITDALEPGSVFKPFTWAAVLDAGLARPEEIIDCENGLWRYEGRKLHDAHAYGRMSVHDGLVHSSNIMAAKLGLRLGTDGLHRAVTRWGFGKKTGLGLPGEVSGLVRPPAQWNPVYSVTSIPMGQEIQVTAVQLAAAYSALANGGLLIRPRLVERIEDATGKPLWRSRVHPVRRVVSRKAARQVMAMLTDVVTRGTGKRARAGRYQLAGKTGTAQKATPGRRGYVPGKWVSSFCGIAPADDPRLVCVIMVDEPVGAYAGGVVAAPAVGRILERALRYLGVPGTP